MNTKLEWPKGATHLRIEDGKKKTIVVKEDAVAAITGVPGTITFLRREKEKGKAESFVAFAGGGIPNPLANVAAPAKAEAKAEPAPKAEAKAEAKAESKPKPHAAKKEISGKTGFIAGYMTGENINKFTARQIADKVVVKFPEAKLGPEKAYAKALRFVRAVPWHLNQRGIKHGYFSEIKFRKEHAPTPMKTASKKKAKSDCKDDAQIAATTGDQGIAAPPAAPVAPETATAPATPAVEAVK